MPAFTYQPFDGSAYTASIGELLARSGDPAARAALATADARARATEASGHAYGQAFQQIGQIPGQIMAQRREEQDHAQRRALQAQQIESGKADAAARTETVARGAQQRLVTTIGTLAKGAASAEDFAARVTDLADLGALPKDVAGHIREQAQGGEWSTVQKRYVDFAAQYARTLDLGKGAKAINEFSGATVAENPEPATPPRTRVIRTIENGVEVEKIVPDESGTSYPVPPPAPTEPKKYPVTVKGPNGQPITKLVTEAELQAGVEPFREPKAPNEPELVQVMGPNGTPIWMRKSQAEGQPAAQAPRAVTGAERQSLAFYNRAKGAVETLTEGDANSLEARMAKQNLLGQEQLAHAPNLMQTEDQQRYRQAQRAFTEARLRKESGAAIPESEFANDARMYFAQPGDSQATIKQKEHSRNTVLEGLKFGAGKAYDEFYGEANVSPKAPPRVGTTRTVNGDTLTWRTVNGQTGWYK